MTLTLLPREAFSQEAPHDIEILSSVPPLPLDLNSLEGYAEAPYVDTTPVGTAKPLPHEVDDAHGIGAAQGSHGLSDHWPMSIDVELAG